MRSAAFLFLLATTLSLALNGCGPSASPTAILVALTPTSVPPRQNLVPPTMTPVPQGKTIVVSSTADSGAGTLRQVLLEAKSGDTITFDPAIFPPNDPVAIYLNSGLPEIIQGHLTIDASNAGVILDGRDIDLDWCSALKITSSGNIIQGFQIQYFSPGAGFEISSAAQHNLIGGDPNTGIGPSGQGNMIGNGDVGISIGGEQTSFNTITGNFIGANRNGECINLISGIYIEDGANHNIIGPDNIVAHTLSPGIVVVDVNSIGNIITQNRIFHNIESGISLKGIEQRLGGNRHILAPVIMDFDLQAGAVAGKTCVDCMVEIFSDEGNQGKIYEGQITADSNGFFAFDKDNQLIGPHLTATTIDVEGNTSEFSAFTWGTSRFPLLQGGNPLPKTLLQTRASNTLTDNHIGGEIAAWEWVRGQYNTAVYQSLLGSIHDRGLKWVRLSNWSPNPLNWQEVLQAPGVYSIPEDCDDFITDLANSGVNIVLTLSAGAGLDGPEYGLEGTPGWGMLGDREPEWWFDTQEKRDLFIEFTRFMVQRFKGRIKYYEIWNEADSGENPGDPRGGVALKDYVLLVKQVAPIIHQIDPEAKVVVGAVGRFYKEDRRWLQTMLESGVASLADAISWHPFSGESPLLYSGEYPEHPERFYWRDYPARVQDFKRQAISLGFKGEYMVEEMVWRTQIDLNPNEPPSYTDVVAAKYLARATILHLGLDNFTMVSSQIPWRDVIRGLPQFWIVCNLSTIMAGADPESLPIEIKSEAVNIANYSFLLPNSDRLVTLWTDGVAMEQDPGIKVTLTVPGLLAKKVIGVDILHGFEQEIITSNEDGNLVIRELLVKDYPLILRLANAKSP